MITTSWLPLAAGRKFTQPRANLLADPCKLHALKKHEICLDVGIPGYSGDSFMFKIKSEFNPIYQTVNLMQSTHVIYQIKSTNMGYLEVKGF